MWEKVTEVFKCLFPGGALPAIVMVPLRAVRVPAALYRSLITAASTSAPQTQTCHTLQAREDPPRR